MSPMRTVELIDALRKLFETLTPSRLLVLVSSALPIADSLQKLARKH
jgi:hypothetical protein